MKLDFLGASKIGEEILVLKLKLQTTLDSEAAETEARRAAASIFRGISTEQFRYLFYKGHLSRL